MSIRDIAIQAQEYQNQYNAGQLSAADFKELVEDLNIQGQIDANADEYQMDQEAREVLMGVIQIVSAIY
jgi:hypothetical protein